MGVIPRSFQQIFNTIRNAGEGVEHLVQVSMLELYNEQLRDSLCPNLNDKKGLEIHEDPQKGFYVKGLSLFSVKDEQDLMNKLTKGKKSRKVRATEMNDYSSRSHSIFSIVIESCWKDENSESHYKKSKLNLVDLAGSEKQKHTKTTDEGLREAIKINLSLTNLGNVINKLVKGEKHIPYRNSKLTKLLQDSLGGNTKTLMIANIGPAASNFAETYQTLKYAHRAKSIQNKPIINEDPKDALLRKKQEELDILKAQIRQLCMGKDSSSIPSISQITNQDQNKPSLNRSSDKSNTLNLSQIEKENLEVEQHKNNLKKNLEEKKAK